MIIVYKSICFYCIKEYIRIYVVIMYKSIYKVDK